MIKPGEYIQYLIDQTSAGAASGYVVLEYTTNGTVWVTDYANSSATFTAGSQTLGRIKNESGKGRVYRFRCTSITSGTISCNIQKQFGPSHIINRAQNVCIIVGDDYPQSGTDGDGVEVAGGGSLYLDSATNLWYRNDGGVTMTNWVAL